MGSIGAGEIILIAIFALILFGPKRLPEIGKQIGRAIAEVRRVSRDFEREVRDAVEPFESEVRKAEQAAKKTYKLDEDFSSYVNTPWPADKPRASKPPIERTGPQETGPGETGPGDAQPERLPPPEKE